jgi:UDP-glucose 4-epimerase
MKRILITGANSYIGTSFEKYMQQWPEQYQVDTVDMIDGTWREKDFSGYDCVYHVAGIAHIKETEENAHLYYKVNRDLAVDTAQKAKHDGVRQFIFLSTMAVYGVEEGAIDRNTLPVPVSHYGKAKLQAEQRIGELRGDGFHVAVLRPPMVYGDGCKGNYQSLVKIAKKLPVFPDYPNKRSMIHIDRLCCYIKELADDGMDGLVLPQDEEYVCTCRMVREIAEDLGRNMKLWKILNPAVLLAKRFTNAGKKAFGDLYYVRDGNDQ